MLNSFVAAYGGPNAPLRASAVSSHQFPPPSPSTATPPAPPCVAYVFLCCGNSVAIPCPKPARTLFCFPKIPPCDFAFWVGFCQDWMHLHDTPPTHTNTVNIQDPHCTISAWHLRDALLCGSISAHACIVNVYSLKKHWCEPLWDFRQWSAAVAARTT